MTIPSRPAPPPPKPGSTSRGAPTHLSHSASSAAAFGRHADNHPHGNNNTNNNQSRYTPTTSWDDTLFNTSPFDDEPSTNRPTKRLPPPRPPPPKLSTSKSQPLHRKPNQPQSVSILTNLFGNLGGNGARRTMSSASGGSKNGSLKNNLPKLPPPPSNHHTQQSFISGTPAAPTAELIDFNSPPSSPTLTQKSNSDCVSVDSFSSDSNYSPHNGFSSQPESGFEDELSGDTGYHSNGAILHNAAAAADPWDDPFTVRPTKPTIAQKPSSFSTNSLSSLSSLASSGKPSPQRMAGATQEFYDPLCNGKSLLPPAPALQMPTIIKPTIKEKPKFLPPPQGLSFMGAALSKSGEDSPPMPQCAPPPPPPCDEFMAKELPATTMPSQHNAKSLDIGPVVALYSYEGTQDEDLSFRENDKLEVLRKMDDEWYYGRDKRGCEGIFPVNYVKAIDPEAEDVFYVRVLYDFQAQAPEDLTIKMGDTVTIFYRINDEWLYGQKGPYQGQFPANFVDHIPSNLPTMPC